MKRKLSVLVIIIVIVAMSMAVIMVLAAQRSFDTEISGALLYTTKAQNVVANQRLTWFDGRPFELNLEGDILKELQLDGYYYEFPACTKEEGVDDRESPIENGVVQIEKERGKGDNYSFRFKWDESTKLLESVGPTGVFTETWDDGILTVTITFSGYFTLNVLLVDEHPKSGKDHCYWFPIWTGELNFDVLLTEVP